MSNLGGFCVTADAIVPIPEDGICEWCSGNRHFIRYRWTGEKWETIQHDDGVTKALADKPENFAD